MGIFYKLALLGFFTVYICRADDSDCVINGHDLSPLNVEAPWMAVAVEENTATKYYISLCSPIATDPCKDNSAAVCKQGADKSTVIGLYTNNPNASHVLEDKEELIIRYEASQCNGSDNYRSIIDLKCGKTLGSPVFLDAYHCDTYFEWQTSQMCKTPSTAKEVKCFLYDKDNRKRDLASLVGTVHNVSTDNGIIELGVCRSLDGVSGSSYPESAGAVLSGKSIGDVTGHLQINDDGHLILKYEASDSTTTITFKCPQRGYGKPPVLLSSQDNQYEIEWETEHACPEDQLQSSTCVLNSAEHGVDVDLTPLKNGTYHPETPAGHEYEYMLSICEKLENVKCPNDASVDSFPTMSVCQKRLDDETQAKVLGQTGSQQHMALRYADGVLTLTYKKGAVCHHNSFQRETIITFTCGDDEGTPRYVGEDDCTYLFEWPTKYACIGTKEQQCTVSDHNGHMYDLSILSRVKSDSSNWQVMKANPASDTNTYWLNLCGPVQNFGEMKCPPGAGICVKHDTVYKSIGKEKSLEFDSHDNSVRVTYSDGDNCNDKGDKTYSAVMTLRCKTGDLDSTPVLISSSSDGCDLELEWETAAACAVDKAAGTGCKVYDPVLGNSFDLTPLMKPSGEFYTVQNNAKQHDYFINVCNNVDKAKCNNKENAGSCQQEHAERGRTFVTGLVSNALTYSSGHLKLTYHNGDAYNGGALRQTEIIFLCDSSKDIGEPEFASETDHTYTFKWYTKHACASVPIECSVQHGTEEYDLSSLSTSSKTWLAVHTDDSDPSVKQEFFIGVCGPLLAGRTSPAVSCHAETAVCGVTSDALKETVTYPDLGHAKKGPEYVEPGHLKLTYTDGGSCKNTQTYSTEIHLHCEKAALDTNPEYVGLEDCKFTFTWKTEAACDLHQMTENTKNCSLYDPISNYVFNFKPLSKKGGYALQTYDKSERFTLNVCDTVPASACPVAKGDVDPAVCSPDQVLGTSGSTSLLYAHEDLLILTYTGLDNFSTEIQFSCNPLVPPLSSFSKPKFINKLGNSKYVFEFQTSLACAPQPVDCVLADLHGNEYDLTALARDDDNWVVEDRFNAKTKYYINVCKPIVRNDKVKNCTDGPLGGCQVTEQNVYNVGYVQSKPSVSDNGTISIQYHNGDLCHKGKEHESYRSMVIFFVCHGTEQGPEFREETPECQYIIDWKTPSACPAKAATGSGCTVTDPMYGRVFDLTPLKKTNGLGYSIAAKGQKGENYTFLLNVCDPLPTDTDVCKTVDRVASCQKGKVFVKDAGKASEVLIYEDGVLVLEYEGGTPCHNKQFNRSTRIEFHCHYGKIGQDGPTYIKESEECKYHFDWETSLACYNFTTYPDCRLTDSARNEYDLGILNLQNDNYEVVPASDPQTRYYINVCGPLVNKRTMNCPPNAASCREKKDNNGKPTFAGIGNIAAKVLKMEGSGLTIEYVGDSCPGVSGKQSKTTILFQCPDDVQEEVSTGPQYLYTEDGCQVHFLWSTKAACPLGKSGSVDGKVTGSGCKVTNPQTGHVFDMSGLASMDGKGYTVEDKFGNHQYIIDVCKSPSSDCKSENTGVCQRSSADFSETWDAGKANDHLLYNDGNPYLNYTDGAPCHRDKFVRNSIITFVCRPEGRSAPEFVMESDDCTYYFDWHTEKACEKQFRCQVTSASGLIDLSPLVKTSGHYTVLSHLDTQGASYHINPCHALNPISGTRCPPGAGVCEVDTGNHPVSLGKPAGPPEVDADTQEVFLHYVNGSSCGKGTKRYSAKIFFQCVNGANQGNPKLVHKNEETCEYKFEWQTDVVCPRQEEKTTGCVYYDNSTNQSFDIGKLGEEEVEVAKDDKFYINVCGKVGTEPDCKNDAVCRVKDGKAESYGEAGTPNDFIPEGENIKMKYTGRTACDKGKKHAYIIFECDRGMTDNGHPEIFVNSDCSAVFMWKTPVVCPNLIMNCVTSREDETYDLRLLSRPEDSWIFAGPNGDIFHLNLCQKVHGYPQCQKDAVVCKTSSDSSKGYSLGSLLSQEITTTGDGIYVRYNGGSKDACNNGKPASVEIHLQCGHTLGRPVFLDSNPTECSFRFLWNTHAACAEKRYQVSLIDGILTEPFTGTQISLEEIQGSSAFYDTLDGKGNHFRINLLSSDAMESQCQDDAVICEHTNDDKGPWSLGDRSSAQFFMQGATLEAVYTTDRVCASNKHKKVTSMIEFECSAASYHHTTGPLYEYSTDDCEHVFVWYTSKMCLDQLSSSHSVEQKHKTAGLIALAVISSILVIVVLALYLKSPERRHRCGSRVRRLFSRSRDIGSYSYSVLSNGEIRGESSASLLSNQEESSYGTGKGDLPSFQDDSDDDIIL